jgi:hypothetical protein
MLLTPECDELLSSFDFETDLRRYNEGEVTALVACELPTGGNVFVSGGADGTAGRFRLTL